MTHRILLVEDETNYRRVLKMMSADFDVTFLEAEHGRQALELLETEEVDLVICDINMPVMDGMTLLKELKGKKLRAPIVMATAYGSIESAVEAMRLGAADYLTKPFDQERLEITLKRTLRLSDLQRLNDQLRETLEERYDFSHIVGRSPAVLSVLETAGKVAATEANVLLVGESGVGKELFARAIHYNSPRKAGPFVAVNCAALPAELIEAELFGAEVGAYTGAVKRRKGRVEAARRGTLFLDEIGELPLALQAKLLRFLQERTYSPLGAEREQEADVRLVFATNKDLEQEVNAGRFREDLLYRIRVVPLDLPPLRDRGEDVITLAEAFTAEAAAQMGRPPLPFAAAARTALLRHDWPGNVRELKNTIERAVILAEDETLTVADLGLPVSVDTSAPKAAAVPGRYLLPDTGVVLEELERDLIEQALDRTGGNKTRAAKLLGLSRATLRYRIEKLSIDA